jgi:hypothetical protein
MSFGIETGIGYGLKGIAHQIVLPVQQTTLLLYQESIAQADVLARLTAV